MDNLLHSVSKKAYNANGVRAKTVYDDVFGGPPKFGVPTLCPRVSDYSEIFGSFHASRASSIPILDLPAVDEAEFSVDVRSSMFDYSEVFGGLNDVDFAASFEELFDQSKTTFDSSDEAWTPAQSESLSDESDPSSERNQNLSNGESHQSCDGIKQINMSCDKASQRSKEDMSSGMAHITQLHAVSGLTSIVNEVPSSQKIEDRNTPLQATDDLNTKMDFSGGLRAEKQFRKTMSHPSNRSFGIQTLGTDLKPVGYGKTASHKNETFVTVSDISLRTQPSQLPPPLKPPHGLAVNGGESGRRKSKLKASKSFAFGEKTGYSSPPFFDVEVDPSSSAAASAAAMKDVMEKAQAKLKSAKELMERKKEGLQSRTKLGLKNDTKDKEGKASKAFDGSNIFKDERVHETCQSDCSGMKAFAGEERKKVMKTTQVASDSIEGGNHINVAKISADKKNGKEDRSSQEFYKAEGTVAWREATQFYEVVEIDKSRKIFEQAKDERHEKKVIPVFQQQEDNRKTKAERETCEREGNEGRSKATKESNMQEEHGKKVKVNQEVCIQEETGKKPRMVQQHGDIDKILTEAASEECDNLIGVHQKENQMEVEEKLKEANERIVDDKRNKDAHEKEENKRRLEETLEMEKYEKRLEEAFERAEIEKGLKEALEREEKERQRREAFEKEEKEKRQKETCEREENEKRLEKAREIEEKKRLKEALELEENEKILALMLEGNEKRLKMALECQRNEKWKEVAREREENEKRLREDLRREEIDKKLKVALEQEVNAKKQKEAHEREENEERLNEDCEREGNEKRLKEVRELDEKKKRLQEAHEREEREKRSEEAFKQNEIEKRSEDTNECEETQKRIEDAGYWEELKGWSKDHEQNERDENERKLKSNQGTCVHAEGGNLKTSDVACKLDDHENLQPGQAACKQDKNSGNVEIIEGNPLFEEDRTMRTEPIDGEDTRLEAVEVVNVLFEEEINSSGVTLDYPQHEKNQIQMKAVKSHHLHDTVTESVEAGIGQTHVHRNKKALKIASNSETPSGLIHELGERRTDVKEVQVTFYKEDSKDKFMSMQVAGELIENGRKMGADKPTVLEGKRNAQSTAQKLSTSKSAERKEKNLNDILIPEEREKEERIKRERELEKDRLRKIEEEREREREREKDRMAVDRATLEAHERTLAEARDRAERAAVEKATAEVRQRAMAEARERLEKASAEARERSLGEKASMEARLRAERAAVERATAEARERAFQKAMVEKATFEERRYIERSVSDKSFASYKNDGMRQSSSFSDLQDRQFQGMRSSSGSIYSYSSVGGASYNNERFVGVEGESAQRCKARLERHQRTAERAAKALAEKNMRDLIAQKEQAERNRFAEALDAEVKRWSSGKEGNLRALLSTLQYILGPNSSWRPIPLTEVITAAAAKKAYRKATLCVHPDKLQQRGASIQQKYICEKVFDLLKEAWNRFNSEER